TGRRRGFQAAAPPGRSRGDGASTIRMPGQNVPARATVATLDGLSAHADRDEIVRWLSGFQRPPRQTYVVHGEPGPAQSLAGLIATRLGWSVRVAQDAERVSLDP